MGGNGTSLHGRRLSPNVDVQDPAAGIVEVGFRTLVDLQVARDVAVGERHKGKKRYEDKQEQCGPQEYGRKDREAKLKAYSA